MSTFAATAVAARPGKYPRPREGRLVVTQLHTQSMAPSGRTSSPSGMNFDDSVFNRLLKDRIIFLGTQFEDSMANMICAQLLLLNAEDTERDITLYINSPGGSVTAGMAIYDTMQYVTNDVATVGIGLAASMGQFILCAGAAGKRYALPHTRIMMHQPSGGIGGSASDIAIQAEQMLYTKRLMQERIAFHTGQSVEQIERDSDRDRWFTADEAKEYGLIDAVMPSAARVADALN
jgi:ATP-dependent Clp protease protease subunit